MLLGTLNCKITIGKYQFRQVNAVEIERSGRLLSDTAKITLPLSAVFENQKKENIENKIKRGDAVTVELAYDDDFNVEFSGFVKDVSAKDKTVIECEDNAYLLRKPIPDKVFKDKTLNDVLKYIANECKIDLNANVMDINLEQFALRNIDGLKAMQKLKDAYGLSVFFDYEEKLFAGLAYTYQNANIEYNLQEDVAKSNLTFKTEEDIKYKIKAISLQKDNTKIEVETGDADGDLRTLYFYGITDKTQLEQLAKEEIKKYKYTGYQGSIKTFGSPFVRFGDAAKITDNNYPARTGTYYVESVKTRFSTSQGFKRDVELGIKL